MSAPLITETGVYLLTMEQYHGQCCEGPSVSSSGLRTLFMQSPAHYYDDSSLNTAPDDEDAAPDAEKEAYVLGRAAHHLLLGEDNFSTQFIARPAEAPDGRAWNGNNTSCKEWLAAQIKAARTVLTPGQIKQIRGMAHMLAEHPLIRFGILNGKIEQSLIWKDKETGVWLKARPDAIPNDSGDFADLKTTAEVGFGLDRSVSKFRYDMQAALTKWAAREVLGIEMTSFSLVFVEKKRPHCVDILTLASDDVARAEHDLRMALRTFAWCHENNNWFGPAGSQSDARPVFISDFAKRDADFRRDFLEREIKRAESVPSPEDYLAAG